MKRPSPLIRARNFYRRNAAGRLFRRPLSIAGGPLVSFTFDDFPRSALYTGGAILEAHGAQGTFFASFGLAGTEAPTGEIFVQDDLPVLLRRGHELGCHTYAHCHSWETPSRTFEESILENKRALDQLLPGQRMRTFSYPISAPRPLTKSRVGHHFLAARAGRQGVNRKQADRNELDAFFLEKSRDDFATVERIIEENRAAGGWLIFATHDVSPQPTPYGCTPEFFEATVRSVLRSGARIVPMIEALALLGASETDNVSTGDGATAEAVALPAGYPR